MNRSLLILASLLGVSTSLVSAQTVSSTPPIGFIRKDCASNSDTQISIPLERQAAFIGPLVSAATNVLTVQGSPGWTSDEFKYAQGTQQETYYVIFLSGAKAGRTYNVTANGTNTLTVDLKSDTLAGVIAGDRIKLLPHWTLASAFPNGDGVEASSTSFQRKTEVLVQDNSTAGINLAPIDTFYYKDGWRGINSGASTDIGPTILPPHTPLVLRNAGQDSSPVFVGVVPSATQTVALRVPAGDSTVKQDNFVSLLRPVPVKLNDSGLEGAAFQETTLAFRRLDELLVYDDSEIGKNKSAKYTYYKLNGAWRRLDLAANVDVGTDEIFTPGTGVIIRKAGTGAATEQIVYWTHEDPTQ